MTANDIQKHSLILLRFQLLNLTAQEMVQVYYSNEKFKDLLSRILYNMKEEPGFFAMDYDILKKIEQINNELRFRFVDGESRNMGNHIIRQLSGIKFMDYETKKNLITDYMMDQVYLRDYIPDQEKTLRYDEFTNLLSFDYITYQCLMDKDYEDLYQSREFLASTNGFLKKLPDLYQQDAQLLSKTKEIILDSLHTKEKKEDDKQYRKMAKRTLSRIKHF